MTGARPSADDPDRPAGCNVVLAGFYGVANLGDEMILSVFLDWVREANGVARVISVHPEFTTATFGVPAASYTSLADVVESVADADLLVLGGGGLFQDHDPFDRGSLDRFPAYNVSQFAQFVHLASELGVPSAVLGQGVGPLRSTDAREITADVFTRAGLCSVRDSGSARLLQAIGVERIVPIAADPAWQVRLTRRAADVAARFPALRGRRVMAVVARDWPFDAHWEQAFVAGLREALPAEWACLWLDFSRTPSADPARVAGSEIAHRLIPRITGHVHAVWQGMHFDDAASLISSCDAAIAMRLHAALVGHLAGIPVVALEYDEKVRMLGEELQVPESQRVPLAAMAARLGPALRRACGLDGEPYRVDVAIRERMRASAREHRDLLWRAMSHARRPRRMLGPASPLLAKWVVATPEAAERVTRAIVRRLQARRLDDGA
jgi:polysaccharide pyruvyl transferase CsaB